MSASHLMRAASAAAVLLAAWAHPSSAGAAGRGGASFHPGGAFRGGYRAAGRPGGYRGLPPVAGIIHERPGLRPSVSWGHTGTQLRAGEFGRAGYGRPAFAGYGHVDTEFRPGFVGGFRYERERYRRAALARNVRRFGFGGGFVGGGGYGDLGDGGFGLGYAGGYGGYGAPGTYGGQGTYGRGGTYAAPGTYGGQGTYGAAGTYGGVVQGGAAQTYPYRSEVPLPARFAESPLGPSPGAPYAPGDRYAYATIEDSRFVPRVVHVGAARRDCRCGARTEPVIYEYGVGTAY